nr:FAD-dependent oxidoreductase [Nocardioides sambongensis]
MRIIVIGGDAAGMSAAHTALRAARASDRAADHATEVVVLEATGHTSYSACGIPYWVAGEVASGDELVARTAEEHRAAGIDLRLHARATAVDAGARTVTYAEDGRTRTLEYDELVLATGAHPVLTDWARTPDGVLIDGVHPVKNLDDGAVWADLVTGPPDVPARPGAARRAVVVGAGYIGVEMAEALLHRGFATTVLTRSGVMGSLDPDMGERVQLAMVDAGVTVRTGTTVRGLTTAGGAVRSVVTSDGDQVEADVVVLALGVVPATELGAEAGLPLGRSAATCPTRRAGSRRTSGRPATAARASTGSPAAGRSWPSAPTPTSRAGGRRRPLRRHPSLPRRARHGDHAVRRRGRDDGDRPDRAEHPAGGRRRARHRGPGHRELDGERLHAGGRGDGDEDDRRPSYPCPAGGADRRWGERRQADRRRGRRALGRMSVDDLAEMDLSYAPPFATVWDALQIAARRLAERI